MSNFSKYGALLKIPAGQKIFSEGDTCHHFVILKSGSIKVYKNSEKGREIVLYRVSPDHLCVLTTTSMLSSIPYSANAMSETDVEAIVFDKKQFDRLIVESYEFRNMVFSSLSTRFHDFVEKIDEVVFHSLKERLIYFLKNKRKMVKVLEMTHQEIASELGTDREVISRILRDLQKDGLVELSKNNISLNLCS